ncbi:MAG: BTAD domain-containing putative transcriptional regulator, partial [Chloroflexota bacterium]
MAHKIELLGSLNITKEGQPQTAVLKREKGCALLAYLMVMRQPHSREALADLLWDARSTKAALTNLRRALHFLRPHIPELLILRKTVAYQPSPDVLVDLYGLEAGLNQSSEIQLREALLAYSGPLLDGFYVDDAPRFNEWLLIARERLYQQVRQGFALYAAKCEARGDWAKGEAVARHWLAQDNYDEAAHRFLMRCLAGQRHRKRALAQFELLYQLLADELGAEPEAETIALREQLITEKMPATLIAPQPDGQGAGVVVPKRYDWGEAPNQHHFFGREPELAQLDQWLHRDRLRLITILGIGGQGKTSLAAMLARGVAHELDGVFWRSLVNAPPLDRILNQLLQFFEQAVPISPETTLHEKFSLLLSYMSQRRALIVLDNVETILSQSEAGRLRAEYEEYAQLFQQIATSNHQSCLLLTSRERPIVLERLERDSPLIQTLPLAGIDTSAGQAILREGGIEDDSETTAQLIERYSGNPLALKLVAETIESLFYGDVAEFLVDETPIFDDIRDVLDQQFARLSTLEQEILLWLAVSREFTSPQAIEKWSLRRVRRRQLLEAMRGLQRRALIEKGRGGFTLQNVVTEYLTDHLVEQVIDEVVSGKVDVSGRIALLLTQSKAFIRQSQNRSILKPIGNALIEIY